MVAILILTTVSQQAEIFHYIIYMYKEIFLLCANADLKMVALKAYAD